MFIVFRAFLEEKCGSLDATTIRAWAKVATMILDELQEAMTEEKNLALVLERLGQAKIEDQNHNERCEDRNHVDLLADQDGFV